MADVEVFWACQLVGDSAACLPNQQHTHFYNIFPLTCAPFAISET